MQFLPLCTNLALLIAVVNIPTVLAQDPNAKGLAISEQVELRDSGWEDSKASLTMSLINNKGQVKTRQLTVISKEVANDGDKSLSVFQYPSDVKGTATLTWSHSIEPDEQWLYLPSLKRIKRISSKNRSGAFMGSEFSFEDISSQEPAKYDHVYLRDEKCGENTCYLVQRTALYEYSGYSKQVVWIDTQYYRVMKIDYYDRNNIFIKTLSYDDYQLYQERYWRATEMNMQNHQTGKSTKLVWEAYSFRQGLTDDDFKKNTLSRAR